MNDQDPTPASMAERWFEEQRAWQKTMREYADSMAKDEEFLTHFGNAMKGSLLAGTSYPTPPLPGTPGADLPKNPVDDRLEAVLFQLKRVEGRLRDLENAVQDLGEQQEEPRGGASMPQGPRPPRARRAAPEPTADAE